MNAKQTRTRTQPRLTAGCVLGVLLAVGPACVGEDLELDPEKARDKLDDSSGSIAYADAGRSDDAANQHAGRPQPAYADAGVPPGNASCEAEPGKPYADAGIYPPQPYVDAGSAPGDAGSARNCFGQLIGDGKTCISDLDLKRQGSALCDAKGYTLDSLKLGDSDCAGGSTEGWVACCEPAHPPPADGCSRGTIGDGRTCIDLASIKLEASAACEAIGASLAGLAGSADERCPDGALLAKYVCCKSDAPLEPSELK